MTTKLSARSKNKRRSGGEHSWVSNNRVLNSNASHKKNGSFGRNPNFDTDETKLLIQLWGDPKVQRTLITTHKKHAVICQLATKMQEYGYYRSPEEITTRIKNLKCFYNRLKKDMDSVIVEQTEPTWKHYTEMDAIMTRPIFSVRPNEVPAPSLKYQLEKAREEREERKLKILAEGGTVSESDDGDTLDDIIALSQGNNAKHDVDDGIIPDVEISGETFAAICEIEKSTQNTVKKRKLSKASRSSMEDTSDYEGEPEEPHSDETETANELQIKAEHDSSDSQQEQNMETACNIRVAEMASCNRNCKSIEEKTNKQTVKVSSSDKNETQSAALIIPKEEPIDVDAEDDLCNKEIPSSNNVKALMPTLADILQMSKSSMVIPSSSTSSGVVIPVSSITTISGSSSMAKVNITPSAPTSQGKISLVPTNFLMQPKTVVTPSTSLPATPPKIHFMQNAINAQGQIQKHILLSGTQPNQTSTNTGIVTTGPGGMKVLLVNADQATTNQMCNTSGLAQQITAAANCMGNTIGTVLPINNAILQQQHQQQKQQHQQQQQQQHQQQHKKHFQEQQQQKKQQEREKQRREELINKKDNTGMRILLRQLLNAQTENNEIQHQRLTLERERLDFERSVSDRFLAALPSFFTQQQQQPQQQYPQFHQLQTFQQPVQAQTTQLRLNPPKLVFKTANVPTGITSNTTTILTPTSLTTSLPKVTQPVEICTQINEFQLLTPKLENEEKSEF